MEQFSGPIRSWLGRIRSVVHFLIWANVVVFVLQLVCTLLGQDFFGRLFALSGPQLARGFVWQPLTYMFLHASIWHILFNLLFLWFFGQEVEYFIGSKNFTRLYLAGGLAGAALWLAFNYSSSGQLLGASAGVLACVVAFATLFPDREVTLLVFFVLPVTLKAKYLAMCVVAIDVVLLLQGDTGVAHLAHLGGAALGYVYIKQLGYGRTPRWLMWLQDMGRKFRPQRRPKPREMPPDEFIREQVDPILDKIAREGMQSLSRRERKILESAKDLMQNQRR